MASFTRLLLLLTALCVFSLSWVPARAATRRFRFNVEWKSVTRLCHTKPLLTVNGQYPGPTIAVHEGDSVEIKVTNSISSNTTLHWHGIRQLRTGWADGPAYITQCPIRAGQTYTYTFQVIDQRGTLWWHSHIFWQRASVNGALIIYPRMPYPFKQPIHAEVPIIFGEWWNSDVDEVEKEMMLSGAGPNVSDAFTINGLPGPLYACSAKDTFIQPVSRGKTYLLRIINAGLNNEMFFAVANHTLTVVEVDATYTKPYATRAIMITPGQTTSVLLTADQIPDSSGMFAMSLGPYVTAPIFPFDNSTAVGFLNYKNKRGEKMSPPLSSTVPLGALLHNLPDVLDTQFATRFCTSLRSLATSKYPCNVPQTIDRRVVSTVGLQLQDCPANRTCTGYDGKRFFSSMNNQSFVRPSTAILQSYYYNRKESGYTTDFSEKPPADFDFTGVSRYQLTWECEVDLGSITYQQEVLRYQLTFTRKV
uniref:laccase n=1 Tax=Kalanchoe fedtschenkoi TaxID=63787 RepID=A0A7N1A7V7_KALFE